MLSVRWSFTFIAISICFKRINFKWWQRAKKNKYFHFFLTPLFYYVSRVVCVWLKLDSLLNLFLQNVNNLFRSLSGNNNEEKHLFSTSRSRHHCHSNERAIKCKKTHKRKPHTRTNTARKKRLAHFHSTNRAGLTPPRAIQSPKYIVCFFSIFSPVRALKIQHLLLILYQRLSLYII